MRKVSIRKRKYAMWFAVGFCIGLLVAAVFFYERYGTKQKFCKCPECDIPEITITPLDADGNPIDTTSNPLDIVNPDSSSGSNHIS